MYLASRSRSCRTAVSARRQTRRSGWRKPAGATLNLASACRAAYDLCRSSSADDPYERYPALDRLAPVGSQASSDIVDILVIGYQGAALQAKVLKLPRSRLNTLRLSFGAGQDIHGDVRQPRMIVPL